MTGIKANYEKNADGIVGNFRIGYWAAIAAFATGVLFLATIIAPIISGAGFPPTGVYLTLISVATLLAAVAMVFLW